MKYAYATHNLSDLPPEMQHIESRCFESRISGTRLSKDMLFLVVAKPFQIDAQALSSSPEAKLDTQPLPSKCFPPSHPQ